MFKFSWRFVAQRVFATLTVSSAVIAIGLAGEKHQEESAGPVTQAARAARAAGSVSPNLPARPPKDPVPVALSKTPWLERAAQLTTLREFLDITPHNQAQQLVEALISDEFEKGHPFANLSSYYPLALLLAKGVREYERSSFRSNEFRGEEGYDLVTYEVTHNDGTRSSIMAYVDKDTSVVDELDTLTTPKRSVYVVFNLSDTKSTSYYNLYRDNELFEHSSMESGRALALVNHRVNASVPFTSVSVR